MKTLVALYDDVGTAREVVSDLIDRGFDRDDISLVTRDFEANVDTVNGTPVDETAEGAAVGAVSGGVLGGVTGLLAGLGALAIPGVGPIIAAGPILAGLTGAGIGAGVGAATGGVLGALVGLDIPEDHVEYYAEGIRRGNTLVAISADENWVESAEEILERHHPINIERRSGYWREAGWEGFNPEADVFTKEDYERNSKRFRANDTRYYEYVPVFRNHFTDTYGDTNYVFTDYEPVYYLGYRLATEDDYRDYDDWDGLEAEAREEWNQAESKLESAWEDVKDTVRSAWESVKDALDGDEEYDYTYDSAFRKHYMGTYKDSGNDYEFYEPGYRYGYRLANDSQYDEIDTWDELEDEAREGWNDVENAAERTWNEIKDAVRHAWEFVTEPFDDDDDSVTYYRGNGANGSQSDDEYGRFTNEFRDHYNETYAGSGNFFDYYEPGYRYGYYLATDDNYADYDSWDELEAEARDEWNDAENAVQRAWDDIKDAARHAWEVVTEPFDDDDDYTY